MPSADLLFRRLLKDLRPALAERGFHRRSQNFVIESPECWGVINFQKSLYSSPEEKKFTVNVAIAVKRVLRFYSEPEDKPPLHYKCHWRSDSVSLFLGIATDGGHCQTTLRMNLY